MKESIVFTIITNIISIFVLIVLGKNYLFLILAPWHSVKEKIRLIKSSSQRKKRGYEEVYSPKISVIVPAWNEEVGILRTVRSVLYNGYSNIQVVIINDGSTDSSDTIIKGFIKKLAKSDYELSRKITYKYKNKGGKGAALNTGISLAAGEIVVTVDADSVLKKGSLMNLVKYYRDEDIMAVVGNVQVVNTSTLLGLAQHLEYYLGFYNKRAHAVLGAEYIFGGACASFRREIFDKVGVFDTKNKTEDIEMSMRLRYFGYKCTYAEDVICYTEGAADLNGLVKQRVRWKKGRIDTFRKYRSMFLSTEDYHNFYLAFFVLPFSALTEIQLLFEPIAITILLIYSFVTLEFVSIGIGIIFIIFTYIITALFSNGKIRPGLILLFPFTWPLFYFLDWIEFMALFKSLRMYVTKEEVTWQAWQRQGI